MADNEDKPAAQPYVPKGLYPFVSAEAEANWEEQKKFFDEEWGEPDDDEEPTVTNVGDQPTGKPET